MPVRSGVDGYYLVPVFRFDVWHRRRGRQQSRIADQHVEPPVALVKRAGEPHNAVGVLQIERDQCGSRSRRVDSIVELFKAADRTRDGDDMSASFGQLQRQRRTDAARRSGDERDAVGERFWIVGHIYFCWPALWTASTP